MSTEKIIKINNKSIKYLLRVNKRSKSLKLSIHSDGECVVTVPRYIPQFIINNFLISKSSWILEKVEHLLQKNGGLYKSKKEKHDEYLKYKNKALVIVKDRIEYFNQQYNYHWNQISIKNQKTRWGSCSSKKNLNFNYKIALLKAEQSDYIIIHELCHLKEMNHSLKFWNLVACAMPNYKEVRNNLRKNGLRLD